MLPPELYQDSYKTRRGFTAHEMVDPVGLIHMNGWEYDPKLGRLVSADPLETTRGNSEVTPCRIKGNW